MGDKKKQDALKLLEKTNLRTISVACLTVCWYKYSQVWYGDKFIAEKCTLGNWFFSNFQILQDNWQNSFLQGIYQVGFDYTLAGQGGGNSGCFLINKLTQTITHVEVWGVILRFVEPLISILISVLHLSLSNFWGLQAQIFFSAIAYIHMHPLYENFSVCKAYSFSFYYPVSWYHIWLKTCFTTG